MKRTYVVVLVGLLISMEVVLTRVLPVVDLPFIRVGFGFLPISIGSMIFGPIGGGAIYALSDTIGVTIMNRSIAPPHPGITLSRFLAGFIFGIFLYKKPKTTLRIFLAALTVNLCIDVGLTTYWLSNLYKEAYRVIVIQRAIVCTIMIPVQTFTIYYVWRYLGKYIESNIMPKVDFRKKTA